MSELIDDARAQARSGEEVYKGVHWSGVLVALAGECERLQRENETLRRSNEHLDRCAPSYDDN